MDTKKAELVFIPSPGLSHLASTVEMAKLLLHHDDQLSITFLLINLPSESNVTNYTDSLFASTSISNRIRFVELPRYQPAPTNPFEIVISSIEIQKPHVKEIVSKLITQSESSPDTPQLAGFVLDMFCTGMIDLATELGVPSYVFYTSGAAFLDLIFYVQALHDEQGLDPTEFKDSDAQLVIPSFVKALPAKVLPSVLLHKDWVPLFLEQTRKLRETDGIMVNTFMELESRAIDYLSEGNIGTPPVYPVGPILNLSRSDHETDFGLDSETYRDVKDWLDAQAPSSVLFLCFGSMGSFNEDQVKEIACALEHCGHPFLWSLRRPPQKGRMEFPSDYADLREVLPNGFVDRTAETGRVIGWAPQVDILGHPAVGGFVSHCGWNSTLESIWFGVPVATWPLHAEQQFNAFQLVTELGLAVEIKMDYRKDVMEPDELILSAEEIKRGIKSLMDHDNNERREKLKRLSVESRKAVTNAGSSYLSLGRLVRDLRINMPSH